MISHWECPKCKRRADHIGEIPNSITCRHCGCEFDTSHDKAVIDKLRAKIEKEQQEEWAARTNEEGLAWDAGREARRLYDAEPSTKRRHGVRSGPLDADEICPYKYIPRAKEQHPLRHWWHMGWTHQEFLPESTKKGALA